MLINEFILVESVVITRTKSNILKRVRISKIIIMTEAYIVNAGMGMMWMVSRELIPFGSPPTPQFDAVVYDHITEAIELAEGSFSGKGYFEYDMGNQIYDFPDELIHFTIFQSTGNPKYFRIKIFCEPVN